ncbi:FAD-dependent monooxygenase [Streptomyces sp. NPDC046881]|uniref:FAD binding domain-containing protein n=1 Tax=Streptomyces sp. NPDC046881 TaxID=3155374 RepID=UPI0033E1B744
MTDVQGRRAIVVGGSLGGLTTALLLRDAGFDVDVFERTDTVLDGRGSGIVLQPDTVRWIVERHAETSLEAMSTEASVVRYIGADNRIVHEEPAGWRFTSWTTLYRILLGDFGQDRYHLGEFAAGVSQDANGAVVRFTSGRTERADLIVFADGISSTARRRLLPEVTPVYSGYVGWRGTVPEGRLSPTTHALIADALGYSFGPSTHICMYPIPGFGGELDAGKRLLNYVWYRNVPAGPDLDELLTDVAGFPCPVSVHPGRVQERFVREMRSAAARDLAPAAAELVNCTEQPFLQVVLDVEVPQMAFGRIAILGDAAFAARPHAAAGTAKAAADAWTLADALRAADGDVPRALEGWQEGQLKTGRALAERVQAMGRRSQFTNDWDPADPELHFGLYGPGK